jgi:hypothetical protein
MEISLKDSLTPNQDAAIVPCAIITLKIYLLPMFVAEDMESQWLSQKIYAWIV